MKENLILFGLLLTTGLFCFGQSWQQTGGTPEGSGVNGMLYQKSTGHLYVATGSITGGDDGGIRRSADDGETWENLVDCYVARVIKEGSDGNLYAAWWPYPEPEGLYRSTDDGDNWELLTTAPGTSYINAVDVDAYNGDKETTIYCGTSAGIFRSLDNGSNWELANNGLPGNPAVFSVAVDSNGYVAIAVSSGVYYSEDQGNTWEMIPGLPEGQSPVLVQFSYPSNQKKESNLIAGVGGNPVLSEQGGFHIRSYSTPVFVPFLLLGTNETPEDNLLWSDNAEYLDVMFSVVTAMPPPPPMTSEIYQYDFVSGNSTFLSTDGLPGSQITEIEGYDNDKSSSVTLFVGLFGGSSGGAKVYKASYTLLGYTENNESSGQLEVKVMPNPSSDRFIIRFVSESKTETSLSIYNLSGEKVWSTAHYLSSAGNNEISWDCSNAHSGIYFYALTAGNTCHRGKLTVN